MAVIKSSMAEMVVQVSAEYEAREGMRRRREEAEVLAREYGIGHWGMVALVLDPGLSGRGLHQRLREVGLTPEEYVAAARGEGYKKFLREWRQTMREAMELQAVESVSEAMSEPRYTRGKDGALSPDYRLEGEVLRQSASAPAVAVQVNVGGAWDRARALARAVPAATAVAPASGGEE